MFCTPVFSLKIMFWGQDDVFLSAQTSIKKENQPDSLADESNAHRKRSGRTHEYVHWVVRSAWVGHGSSGDS